MELDEMPPEKIIMATSPLLRHPQPQPESSASVPASDPATPITTSKSSSSSSPTTNQRDFLTHLETYLAKRDGVDKLLKISRYTAKIILTASPSTLPPDLPLSIRLKSFESSLGLSRKAFRLGKFIQDVNALRASLSVTPTTTNDGNRDLLLSILAYGGEGLYYFIEQFVWLAKTGLIDPRHARDLQKFSAWMEFIGYVGSIGLKIRDLRKLNEEKACLDTSFEIVRDRRSGEICDEDLKKLKAVEFKIVMKKFSVVQDLADGLMAVSDIRDGKSGIFSPFVLASAGLISALISTHKNWISC